MATKIVKGDGLSFKVFTNSKIIKAMDPIVYFKPAVKVQPLAGAIVAIAKEGHEADEEADEEAIPKKKQKLS